MSPPPRHRALGLLAGLGLFIVAPGAWADAAGGAPPASPPQPEARNTGWALYFDNDAFASGNRDEGYTGGALVTLSGRRAREHSWSLDPVLGWLDGLVGLGGWFGAGDHSLRHAASFGLTVFTPNDTAAGEPLFDQHPYANVLFMGNTRRRLLSGRRVSYHSTFVAGLLGTPAGELVQNASHEILGFEESNGWDNEISEGGEPTALYAISREQMHLQLYDARWLDLDLGTRVGGSVGFITELNAGIQARLGKIRTPWWDFNPNYANYVNLGTPVASGRTDDRSEEVFLWAGFRVRQRFYNALLEGQFRDSEVEFDRGQLDSVLYEASGGITYAVGDGTRVTLALRGRSQEIRDTDTRAPLWGSLTITRAF